MLGQLPFGAGLRLLAQPHAGPEGRVVAQASAVDRAGDGAAGGEVAEHLAVGAVPVGVQAPLRVHGGELGVQAAVELVGFALAGSLQTAGPDPAQACVLAAASCAMRWPDEARDPTELLPPAVGVSEGETEGT
ncbi:hypothetical protein QBC31_42815 [Streptomyces sp. B21-079]|uniref:hypothetical protein n=1 Tax=Streptomyces sp. B21-079 TaxID=3039409 RepID=UPI002FF2C12C